MAKFERPPAKDHAAHYRLSAATWEIILKEYREGATARFLSKKWRVSMHAIRKRITQHGATKRQWGDEQAINQATEREEELEEARRNTPEALAARLFNGLDSCDDSGDPVELARTATQVSGRAMRLRLWAEARALASLAESYFRLADKPGRQGGTTIETVDLQLLFDIVFDRSDRVRSRFAIWGNENDPDIDLKREYWRVSGESFRRVRDREDTNLRRAFAAERKLRELGVEPPELTEVENAAAREAANWLLTTDEEIAEQVERMSRGDFSRDDDQT